MWLIYHVNFDTPDDNFPSKSQNNQLSATCQSSEGRQEVPPPPGISYFRLGLVPYVWLVKVNDAAGCLSTSEG